MKLIIDIPEDLIECIKSNPNYYPIYHFEKMWRAIANGMPLPKGHGRILDEKEILNTEKHDGGWYDLVDLPEYIAGVPAIVEADKGEQE